MKNLKRALFIVVILLQPLKALCNTINHFPLYVCPLAVSCLLSQRMTQIPPPTIMCEGLVCPCVLVCKTAGPSGWWSKIYLATLAQRARGVLMEMESYWANEAPNLSYRSTSQRCITEITEEESGVWHHTRSDLCDI